MEDEDEFNVTYSQIIYGMGEDAIEEFERAEFDAEVDAVTLHIKNGADYYAEVFDAYVVAAALKIVAKDYHTAIGGDEE